MNKTAVVAVTRILEHPVYKKRLKRIKKYHVHDEMGSVVGDRVKFVDSKPVSKTKKWTISKILKAK
jgi:small subunit ribosomal protein S17